MTGNGTPGIDSSTTFSFCSEFAYPAVRGEDREEIWVRAPECHRRGLCSWGLPENRGKLPRDQIKEIDSPTQIEDCLWYLDPECAPYVRSVASYNVDFSTMTSTDAMKAAFQLFVSRRNAERARVSLLRTLQSMGKTLENASELGMVNTDTGLGYGEVSRGGNNG